LFNKYAPIIKQYRLRYVTKVSNQILRHCADLQDRHKSY